MATVDRDPQIGFDEQIIVDKELENALGDYVELREQHRNWLASKNTIKTKLKDRTAGRYRCGSFVLELKDREGGGISIPDWTAKVFSLVEG